MTKPLLLASFDFPGGRTESLYEDSLGYFIKIDDLARSLLLTVRIRAGSEMEFLTAFGLVD